MVELLVVLTVMVALGGMLTLALASATTDARIKRTQADVLTIGQLLQSRVNEVSLAPVNLIYGRSGIELVRTNQVTLQGLGGPGTAGITTNAQRVSFMANERARLILYARRDMARLVLPECQADLFYPPASLQFRSYHQTSAGTGGWVANVAQVNPPPQWNRMRRLAGLYTSGDIDAEYNVANGVNGATSPATNPEFGAIAEAGAAAFEAILKQDVTQPWSAPAPRPQSRWTRQYESSECLYLILATTDLFGQRAIDKIPQSQIEDTDNDGIPEILDAWGNPYEYIRNPIGYKNPAIKNYDPGGATPADQFPFDPDPFDFLAADLRYNAGTHPAPLPAGISEAAYYPIFLPPLVISAGRDGEFGIRLSFVDSDGDGAADEGVNDSYSSSAVQYPGSGGNRFLPVYFGVPVVRFPDPFFNVNSVSAAGTGLYEFSIDGIAQAKQDGGLGAILDPTLGLHADNISSLDAGF
ncbi:hypothetical protein NHH03_18005 [Stieleria sp. TO1_6]|nr:hypothetical protein [Stieleria tagensis]